MRKVTKQIVSAFLARQPLSVGNSCTDGTLVYLHGNAIVQRTPGGIEFSLAGWPTPTTKERINGVLDALSKPRVYRKNWQMLREGKPIPTNDWVAA